MIRKNGKLFHTKEEKEKMSKIKKKQWKDKKYRDMQMNARKNSNAYQNKSIQQAKTLIETYKEHPEIKERISKTVSEHHANEEYRKEMSETKKKLIRDNPKKFSKIGRKGGLSSRKNQKNPSSIEKIMSEELKKNNIQFIPQRVMLNRYRVDFLIDDDFLVIECDGDYWHRLPNIAEKDIIRDKVLSENGFIVLRFWEHEIKSDVSKCVNIIKKYLIDI